VATRRNFAQEYKDQAISLVLDSGRSIVEVAKSIGVHEMTLGKWVKKARESGRVPDKDLSEPERAELERLRQENATLRVERDFAKSGRLYVSWVDRILDSVRLGVHLAAAAESADGRMSRTPPFVDRDRMPDVRAALVAGGFVLLVGDSTAGKSRLAFEAMHALPAGARLRHA
jgi:transposase